MKRSPKATRKREERRPQQQRQKKKPAHKRGERQPQEQREKKRKKKPLEPPSGPLGLVPVKTEPGMPLTRSQKPSESRDHHGDELLLGHNNYYVDAAMQTAGEGNSRMSSRLKRKWAPATAVGECKGRKKKTVANDDEDDEETEGTPPQSDDSSEEGAVKLPVENADKNGQDSERKPPADDEWYCYEASEALDAAIAPAVDKMAPDIARMLAACLNAVETTVLDTKKLNAAIDQLTKITNDANADLTGAVVRDICSALSPLLASMIPETVADISSAMKEAAITWVTGIAKKVRSTCRVAIREALQEEIRSEFREHGMVLPPPPGRYQHHYRSPARRGLNSRTGPKEDPYSSSASEDRSGRRVKPRAGQERPGCRMTRARSPTERPGVHAAGGNSRSGPDVLPQPPRPAYRSSPPPPGHGHGHNSPVWHPPEASYEQQPRREEPMCRLRREESPNGRGRSSLGQPSFQQAPNSRHQPWSASQPRWNSLAMYGTRDGMNSRRGR